MRAPGSKNWTARPPPPFQRDGLSSPVIIDSIRLLKRGNDYLIHVRSKDGAEGISLSNPPAQITSLHPEAARHSLLHRKRRARPRQPAVGALSLAGQLQTLWPGVVEPQAWVEFAILDMLGRIVRKPMARCSAT